MSAANVELVKGILPDTDLVEAFAGDPPQGILTGDVNALDPDLEVEFAGTLSGAPTLNYRGIEGLVEGWRDWLTPWESYLLEAEEFIDGGDRVLELVRVRARTSRHGVEVEHSPAAVWTVQDGVVVSVHFFLERREAFEFAGLPPPN
jgi:ketosteroid isomerase-like protein